MMTMSEHAEWRCCSWLALDLMRFPRLPSQPGKQGMSTNELERFLPLLRSVPINCPPTSWRQRRMAESIWCSTQESALQATPSTSGAARRSERSNSDDEVTQANDCDRPTCG